MAIERQPEPGPEAVRRLIREQVAEADTGWSLGGFGAIAEFLRTPGEPVAVTADAGGVAVVTDLGAMRIDWIAGLRPVAYETAVEDDRWSHAVALCLEAAQAAMNRRSVVTELGPDEAALRPGDREAILFDLGLGMLQADICVRSADPALLTQLRAGCGQSLFAPGNSLTGALIAAGPHRVFQARLGRIEVYQPVPPADGRSPEGPHTHVLPKLLASGRTHAATAPIPAGWVPCAHLFPPHPARDAMGRSQPFDRGRHDAFQAVWREFGDPHAVALKDEVMAALGVGQGLPALDSRADRAVGRVARCQTQALASL
ncbi:MULTISPECIES: DUF6925 family protein [unclassified Inquilinus]|uniref:DUF6925 family protein n=1 Tax=unclassified Inquilinus TaxID=2645927 RepID=UPI003F92442E